MVLMCPHSVEIMGAEIIKILVKRLRNRLN